ncbi:uncharacterized protein LOC135275910 [Aotus nancymaae]|uniref:uncharacterized protein LOC135275910 n=1 Tax=Aotus nancymaae TaxID=37293 RepID=UPI0030FEEC26
MRVSRQRPRAQPPPPTPAPQRRISVLSASVRRVREPSLRGSPSPERRSIFVRPIRALQQNGPSMASWGFSSRFKCTCAEKAGGEKSNTFPPPLIICGAGVTRAGANGAYKDLCARKGIRLQAQRESGRSAHAQCTQLGDSAICSCCRVRSTRGPRNADGWSRAPVTRRLGVGKICQMRERWEIWALSWHRHTQDLLVSQFPTETTELKREACSLGAVARRLQIIVAVTQVFCSLVDKR